MDNYRKFVENNLIVLSGHILIYAKSIILLPLLIKNIGIQLYGGYVLLTLAMGFISAVSTLGVGFKFKRYMPSARSSIEQGDLFYPQLLFQLISILLVSCVLIVSVGPIKTWVFRSQFDFSMPLVSLILLSYVLYNVSTDYFRYTHRMQYFTIATCVETYLMILLIIIFMSVFHIKTLNSLLTAYLLSMLFVTIPLALKIFKEIGFKLSRIDIHGILEDMRLGFPLLLSYFVDFILSSSDRYVIAALMSATAVGLYNPAYTLGSLIILIPKACAAVVLPPLISNADDTGKKDQIRVLTEYTIKLFLVIAIPFIACLFILSKPLLELFANREVASTAYLVAPVVALATLFYGLNLIFSQILFVKLKIKAILGINALSATINLLLNIAFIYIFKNILVAAITTLASYLASFIILNSSVKNYFKIRFDRIFIIKSLAASLITAVFLYCTSRYLQNSLLNAGFSILFAAILYLVFIFIFGILNKREIMFVKTLFISK